MQCPHNLGLLIGSTLNAVVLALFVCCIAIEVHSVESLSTMPDTNSLRLAAQATLDAFRSGEFS